jgi:hypothetical protein
VSKTSNQWQRNTLLARLLFDRFTYHLPNRYLSRGDEVTLRKLITEFANKILGYEVSLAGKQQVEGIEAWVDVVIVVAYIV